MLPPWMLRDRLVSPFWRQSERWRCFLNAEVFKPAGGWEQSCRSTWHAAGVQLGRGESTEGPPGSWHSPWVDSQMPLPGCPCDGYGHLPRLSVSPCPDRPCLPPGLRLRLRQLLGFGWGHGRCPGVPVGCGDLHHGCWLYPCRAVSHLLNFRGSLTGGRGRQLH